MIFDIMQLFKRCMNFLAFFHLKQVFNKLIRRYKYLEKGFEEEIKKVRHFSEIGVL